MVVDIDDRSGFCFGVENAVDIAEKALAKGEKVFSLGQIVHNDIEVERLSALGLVSVNHDQFRELKDCKVLIRAHGEPPETYLTAKKNNITIIEATCPIVKKFIAPARLFSYPLQDPSQVTLIKVLRFIGLIFFYPDG